MKTLVDKCRRDRYELALAKKHIDLLRVLYSELLQAKAKAEHFTDGKVPSPCEEFLSWSEKLK